jgi:hypothetical protein
MKTNSEFKDKNNKKLNYFLCFVIFTVIITYISEIYFKKDFKNEEALVLSIEKPQSIYPKYYFGDENKYYQLLIKDNIYYISLKDKYKLYDKLNIDYSLGSISNKMISAKVNNIIK